MRYILFLALASAVLLWAGTPALATSAEAAGVTWNAADAPTDVTALTREAETYFAQFKTAKARFVQTAPDGTQRVGTFYLSRPGKLRFDYDAPVADMVVADGLQLYFYDGELKQTSSAPVGQTLADFLLRKDIKFSGDLRVMGAQEGGGLKQLMLTQTADPDAGIMTLGFATAPFGLKKWRVVDSTGQTTEVELFDVQENVVIPASTFVYRDPKYPKGRYND